MAERIPEDVLPWLNDLAKAHKIPQDIVNSWCLELLEEGSYNLENRMLIRISEYYEQQPPEIIDLQIPEMDMLEINQFQKEQNERILEVNLPNDHFVTQFVKYQRGLSDAYVDYHIVNAFWLLSALTQGKVVLKLKQETVKPNMWIVVIGKSTTSRKSTAVNSTRKSYEVATDCDLPNDDYSIEGYLESLVAHPKMNNVRDEAAGLLAKFHKKYNEGIFDLECSLYDCQNIKKTLSSSGKKEPRTFIVKNPYVTKLYATTNDNFARYMTMEDFTCGYGFRFIYAYPKYKHDRKPLALETQEDIKAWGEMLVRIKDLYQKFTMFPDSDPIKFQATPEAMKYHDETCKKLEAAADEQNNDILNAVIGRSEIHILKLAILIEIGKKEPSFTITLDSVKIATKMITEYFIPCIMDLISQLQEDVKNNKIEKIKAVLRRFGGKAAHAELLRNSNMVAREFSECIATMSESNAIKIVTESNTKARYYMLIDNNKPFKVG